MFRWIVACVLVIAVGCAPARLEPQQAPLPTLFPTSTPEFGDPYEHERIATEFLHHWEQGDFAAMYNLLSFASQQATNFEAFRAAYEDAHRVMRLENLDYNFIAQIQDNYRVAEYIYDVAFESTILGTFSDTNRILTLVLDEDASGKWRIAWSAGTIFAEMENGGQLQFRSYPPRRADIYDRNGNILADMNGNIVAVSIVPGDIPDLPICMDTLVATLDEPIDQIQARIANFGPTQLGEVGEISPDELNASQSDLELYCDARFESRPTRRYLYGDLAPHIIGSVGYPTEAEVPEVEFAGFPQDAILGRSGVEKSWDAVLRGRPGSELWLVRPNGERLRQVAQHPPEYPQSVYLTIDRDLQLFALKRLIQAFDEGTGGWAEDSKGGALIILDVNTGSIWAMVSYPTYDGNAYTPYPYMGEEQAQALIKAIDEDIRRPLVNRASQGSYPTGSTMKVVTAIAALESGVFDHNEHFVSVGVWSRDIPRYDWRNGGHGSVTLSQALTVSCNSCFYEAGYRLDQQDPYLFSSYANKLGLGVSTGIADIAEVTGLIGTPDNKQSYEPTGIPWNFSDMVNIAIGQGGVQVTPLQLVRVYAAIANGGKMYRPQLVEKTGLLNEFYYQMQPDLMNQVRISQATLESVRQGLCNVTTIPAGTASHIFTRSRLLELGVCAKTGTATSATGNAFPHAWFAAYAPSENPEIAIVAMVENSGEGSGIAAPIVRDVLEYYFYGEDLP